MSESAWPRVAVMGAGAVGCWFGGVLARAGAPVTLIGRARHVDAIAARGLVLDSVDFHDRVRVAAAVEPAAARGADIVLFCVKTVHTESAARALTPHVAPDTVLVSLQNGVDNVERMRVAAGLDALAAVVYVAAEMSAPGTVRHRGRGDLIVGRLGAAHDRDAALDRVTALFARAGVPCVRSADIEADLWTKLIMNCAYNAISALTGRRYGVVARNPWTREIVRAAIAESVAVARAAGVMLPRDDLVAAGVRLGEAMSEALSSTAQDIALGRPTEIDSLNGYIARRGDALGVATPVNHTLHALVKLREEAPAPA